MTGQLDVTLNVNGRIYSLEREPDISDELLLEVLASNLCRCTGYQGIVAGVRAASAHRPWPVRRRHRLPPPTAHARRALALCLCRIARSEYRGSSGCAGRD